MFNHERKICCVSYLFFAYLLLNKEKKNTTKNKHPQRVLIPWLLLWVVYLFSKNAILIYISNIIIYIYPSTPTECDSQSIFKRSLTGLNSEFSFSYTSCHTKVKDHSLSNDLPIARERRVGYIYFLNVLALCEMWNVNCLIQDLNSVCLIHFKRR